MLPEIIIMKTGYIYINNNKNLTIIHELIQCWSKLTHATIFRGKLILHHRWVKIELIQLNHDNFITNVGQQIKSSYHHKMIYSPN
jgi:hypothetical protein